MGFETSATSQRRASAIFENGGYAPIPSSFLATLLRPARLVQREDAWSTEALATDLKRRLPSEAPK